MEPVIHPHGMPFYIHGEIADRKVGTMRFIHATALHLDRTLELCSSGHLPVPASAKLAAGHTHPRTICLALFHLHATCMLHSKASLARKLRPVASRPHTQPMHLHAFTVCTNTRRPLPPCTCTLHLQRQPRITCMPLACNCKPPAAEDVHATCIEPRPGRAPAASRRAPAWHCNPRRSCGPLEGPQHATAAPEPAAAHPSASTC